MSLKQNGDKITGTYTPHNGKIEGQVSGRVLRFKWSQGDQRGSGRFILSKDGNSFSGSWSNSNDPDDPSGGTWDGVRVQQPKPNEHSESKTGDMIKSLACIQDLDVKVIPTDAGRKELSLSFRTLQKVDAGVEIQKWRSFRPGGELNWNKELASGEKRRNITDVHNFRITIPYGTEMVPGDRYRLQIEATSYKLTADTSGGWAWGVSPDRTFYCTKEFTIEP